MNRKKVLILLSTYNGERYIKEQIDSLLFQVNVDLHILIRDDGSKDSTCDVINQYVIANDNITLIKDTNVGCCRSFYELAKYAYDKYTQYDYYAFCDQDDVWMKDKLERACTKLDKFTSSSLLMYASAYQMVDCNLNDIPTIMIPSNNSFGESLMIQTTIGCTMVFNYRTLLLFLKGNPNKMLMHDSWIYKMILGCGGTYVYDARPSILYRQHTNNVKGANHNFYEIWRQRWDNFLHNRRSRSLQAKYLLEVYKNDLTRENRRLLSDFVAMRTSTIKRFKVFTSSQYRTINLTSNLLFRIAVLFNKV